MIKKLVLIAVLGLVVIKTCIGQTAESANSYKTDLKIFRDSMERVHPALYRYTGKTEFNRLFDSCYAAIGPDMTRLRFFMMVKFLTNAVKDGHLNTSLPREVVQGQLTQAKVFPIRLWFTERGAFVYCSNDQRLAAGVEIISIDNKPINQIRAAMFNYLVADGSIQSKRFWYLNSSEGTFQFFYHWLYGEREKFVVTYRSKNGSVETLVLDAALLTGNKCFFEPKRAEQYLSLDLKGKDVAVLTVKSFDINKLSDDENTFGRFLDSAFRVVNANKINNLIIDLRDNGGGEDSYGAMLYAYLADKPFSYYRSIETIFSTFPKTAHPNLALQYPKQNSFKGKCYFLINGKSFSTTAEFCAIAKSNDRGTFIGEETGGGYYGNTGGDQVRFALPFSGINIFIPKRKYVLEVKRQVFTDRGVLPDYVIVPNVNDVLQNKDVQMEFTLKLARGK